MRSVLLVGCLILVSCGAPSERVHGTTSNFVAHSVTVSPAQDPALDDAPTAAEPTAPPQDVPGLDLLSLAIAQNAEPDLWMDAGETLVEARDVLAAARQAGASPELDAALATTDALIAWRAWRVYAGNWPQELPGDPVWDPMVASWHEHRGAWLTAIETLLVVSQGRHPETDEVLLDVLFRSGQTARAEQELGASLRRWPAHGPMHDLARDWRDVLPDPAALTAQLEEQLASDDAGLPGFTEQALCTRGVLLLSSALRVQEAGDLVEAVRLFEAGADALARADGPAQSMDAWELASRRADCLVNAGWLRFAEARQAIETEGLDAALPSLQLAEKNFVAALKEVPGDPDASQGIGLTGDLYYQAGSLEGIRDFFGRVAPQFENPEWWNNHAFFCRETGEYETSYASYQQCIAITPDNPRWVNDTGLILLYHLDRDLDLAEEYFRRAWALGVEVCENPFVSDEKYEDAFLGYTDAMHNLSLLLARQGDYQQAVEVNAELLEIAPGRPDATQLKFELERALAESAGSDEDSLK
ncbi:MAG: hypothetical protein ACYTCU_03755 [Planctomycetota bacterium]